MSKKKCHKTKHIKDTVTKGKREEGRGKIKTGKANGRGKAEATHSPENETFKMNCPTKVATDKVGIIHRISGDTGQCVSVSNRITENEETGGRGGGGGREVSADCGVREEPVVQGNVKL